MERERVIRKGAGAVRCCLFRFSHELTNVKDPLLILSALLAVLLLLLLPPLLLC